MFGRSGYTVRSRLVRGRSTGRAGVALVLGVLLVAAVGKTQPAPGTIEEVRAEIQHARACYEWVDYRCVIASLDGPLLVHEKLPDGLTRDEVREAYEILSLGYLAVGMEEEGRRAFLRLLELQPDYLLERSDAAPEHMKMVEVLSSDLAVRETARRVASRVQEQAQLICMIPDVQATAASVAVRMAAAWLAGYVHDRSVALAPIVDEPPWGPLRGPSVSVGAVWRGLYGDDVNAWEQGVGTSFRLRVSYRPIVMGLLATWSRHTSALRDPAITPPPSLQVVSLSVQGGVGGTGRLAWDVVVDLGTQILVVAERVRSFNPNIGVGGSVAFRIVGGLEATGHMTAGWTMGGAGPDEFAVSFTSVVSLGFGYRF